MSKRLIDSEMTLKPWFRALKPRLKCLWLWMFTRCDMAGVIDMDWELASFAVGEKVSANDLAAMNGNAVVWKGSKVFLPGFIPFQYGSLNEGSPVHKSVIKVLSSHNIPYPYPMDTVLGDSNTPKAKDKDSDKDNENEKAKAKTPVSDWYDKVKEQYQKIGVDVDAERVKAEVWLTLPQAKRRQFTQRYFVNWLSRADRGVDGTAKQKQIDYSKGF